METDIRIEITCFYSEEDGEWAAEEPNHTGFAVLSSCPFSAINNLSYILPDGFELIQEMEEEE